MEDRMRRTRRRNLRKRSLWLRRWSIMARLELVRLIDGKALGAHGGVWTGAARRSMCGQNDSVKNIIKMRIARQYMDQF